LFFAIQAVYHVAHGLVFTAMLILLHMRLMHDSHLIWVCYLILLLSTTFCGVALPFEPVATFSKRVAAEGVWQVNLFEHHQMSWNLFLTVTNLYMLQVVFVTFIVYTMLPLRTYMAALFSILLSIAHITLTAIWADDWLTWQQVSLERALFDDIYLP
jgi:hypothetical protein